LETDVQDCSYGVRQLRGFRQRGQLYQPDTISKNLESVGCEPQREPRFADTAAASNGEQACASQAPDQLSQVLLATNKAALLGGQIVVRCAGST